MQSSFTAPHKTNFRVCYAHTDKMGVVYYGNYLTMLEVGRTETMRELGISYHEMEERGILMPAVEAHMVYKKPAKYDDLLTIVTVVERFPKAKIKFKSEIFNQNGEILADGYVVLAFVNKNTGRPTRCPEYLLRLLQ